MSALIACKPWGINLEKPLSLTFRLLWVIWILSKGAAPGLKQMLPCLATVSGLIHRKPQRHPQPPYCLPKHDIQEGEKPDKNRTKKAKVNHVKCQAFAPCAPQPASHQYNFGSQGSTEPQKQALEKIILNFGFVTQALGCMSAPNPVKLRAALQAPQNFKCALPKESSYPVIWDSGASMSISLSCNDFVEPIKSVPFGARVQSLTNGLSIKAQGMLCGLCMTQMACYEC